MKKEIISTKELDKLMKDQVKEQEGYSKINIISRKREFM